MLTVAVALFALTSLLFASAWLRRRDTFLYPSTWILLLTTLIYIAPAAVFMREVQDMSPYTVTALLYSSIFVVVGMTLNLLRRRLRLDGALGSAVQVPSRRHNHVGRALRMALVGLACITAAYLLYVPLSSTGLYGVLFDPENSAQLREESLKLLNNAALQYLYLIGFSALSPLAFALTLARAEELHGWQRWALLLSVSLFLAFYLLITGARVGLVNLTVCGLLYAFFHGGMKLGLKPLIVGVAVIFGVPILMSVLREQGRNEATMFEYVEAIGERIFLLPLLISGWFVEFAETRGYVGLLAAVGMGEQINWSNMIALEFLDRKEAVTIESVSTPTAFIFTNYLYVGWLGLLPAWVALRVIDWPVGRLHRVAPVLRRPILVTLVFFSVIFVQSAFGVVLISHGYLLLMGVVWWMGRSRASRSALVSI